MFVAVTYKYLILPPFLGQ